MTDRPERKKKKKREKDFARSSGRGRFVESVGGSEEGNNRVDSRDLVDGVVFRGCCSSGY